MTLATLAGLLLLQAAHAPSIPERFFLGRTEGQGTANVIMSGSHSVRHRGTGRLAPDGSLHLEQIVEEQGKAPRRRTWRLVRAGPNRFTGTISDARGPVTGTVDGATLHITYRAAEGPNVEQWITVQPGGRTARNRMIFRRFGVRVATMEETIRRVD